MDATPYPRALPSTMSFSTFFGWRILEETKNLPHQIVILEIMMLGLMFNVLFFFYDGRHPALVIFLLDHMRFSVETEPLLKLPLEPHRIRTPSPKIEISHLGCCATKRGCFFFREAVVGVQLSHDGNWVLSQAQDCEIRFAPKFGEDLGFKCFANRHHMSPKFRRVGYDRMFRKIRKFFVERGWTCLHFLLSFLKSCCVLLNVSLLVEHRKCLPKCSNNHWI